MVVVDDRTAVGDALRWGAGMGLLPSFLGEPGVADESLWRVTDDPVVGLPIHALYHRSHRDDARVQILIEEIQEQLETLF
jgi:DNA-binding transcriptional LysR family regulator